MRPAIGVTVWVFNENRRVYAKGGGGPIYREHFVARRIVEETTMSWILDDGTKINKRTKESAQDFRGYRRRIFDESQVNDACYVHDERYRIAQLVQRCDDADKLRRIEALVLCEEYKFCAPEGPTGPP